MFYCLLVSLLQSSHSLYQIEIIICCDYCQEKVFYFSNDLNKMLVLEENKAFRKNWGFLLKFYALKKDPKVSKRRHPLTLPSDASIL